MGSQLFAKFGRVSPVRSAYPSDTILLKYKDSNKKRTQTEFPSAFTAPIRVDKRNGILGSKIFVQE